MLKYSIKYSKITVCYELNISFDPCLYLFLDLQDFVHASEDQLCVDTPTSEDLIDDVGKHKNK